MDKHSLVLWAGFGIGLLFGLTGQRSGFCLLSALRDYWQTRDGRKLRAFVLAMAVALLGTQLLVALDLVTLRNSLYLQRSFSWLLVPLGGLLFGYGMVLANACGARALVLLGTGNLRSLLVLLCLGISAYVCLRGVLAPVRIWLADASMLTLAVRDPSLHGLLVALGVTPRLAPGLATVLVAVPLLWFALSSAALRSSTRDWLGGLLIGALIPAGWYVTGNLGADPFTPARVVSLSFIAPVGDALQYLMLATGMRADFGILVIAGVPVGACLGAILGGSWYWQGFESPAQMRRAITGGVLMGLGGALALGCSIGQGLTGFSTLALASFVAVIGIVLGAWLGLRGPLRVPR